MKVLKKIVAIDATACLCVALGGTMKRNFFGLCCAGMVLCLCLMACNKKNEQEQEVPAGTQNQQDENWVKIENIESKEMRASINSGRALANLTKVGTDNPYYCNVEANLSNGMMEVESHLVCKDPVYDITYYVNYGRDYFIYASRSGVSEVAVEIPAKELFCREGELYFIADTYSAYVFEGMEPGNILKYNPVDGTVEVVIERNVMEMRVYPDAIHCAVQITFPEEENSSVTAETRLCYSFETEQFAALTNNLTIERWRDKRIKKFLRTLTESEMQRYMGEGFKGELQELSGWAVVDSNGEHLVELPEFGSLHGNFRLYGDCMYYIKNIKEEKKAALMEFNCVTGENRQVVKFDIHGSEFITSDFIILDDVVYLGSLYRYSLKEEKLTMLKYSGGDREFTVEALYTDGDELFGVADGYLWKIQVEKAKEDAVGEMKVNGDSVVYGEYMYSLVEP